MSQSHHQVLEKILSTFSCTILDEAMNSQSQPARKLAVKLGSHEMARDNVGPSIHHHPHLSSPRAHQSSDALSSLGIPPRPDISVSHGNRKGNRATLTFSQQLLMKKQVGPVVLPCNISPVLKV